MKIESEHRDYIIDASTLIDYADTDLSVLKIFSENIGQILIPIPIIEEVKQISEEELVAYNFKIIVPTIEQIIQAFSNVGVLSFADLICLIIAQKNNCTIITNDKSLQREAEKAGVNVIRGLRVMIMLVGAGLLSKNEARKIAKKMSEINRFITTKIISDFMKELSSI